jgi:amino acid permease
LGIVLNLFAILAATTAFLGLGFALKESFCEDFGMSDVKSWFFTMIVPAVLVFVGVRSFWKVLEFVGGFTGGLLLILILLMHFKARKSRLKSEFVLKVPNWSYILLFALLGIIVFSSLWYMV